MYYRTMEDIRHMHQGHFFDKGAKRFFRSKIFPTVYGGRYFITREEVPYNYPKYTIREVDAEGNIERVGEFNEIASLDEARRMVKQLVREAQEKEKEQNR